MTMRIARRACLALVLSIATGSGPVQAFSFCFSFGAHRNHDFPGPYLPPPPFPSYAWQPDWPVQPDMPGPDSAPQPRSQQQPAARQPYKAPVISFPERY
jgi:hypothetical protein